MDEQSQDRTVDELFGELDFLARQMESEETGLEESFSLYQKAMGLLKECREHIDRIEKKLIILDENGEINE